MTVCLMHCCWADMNAYQQLTSLVGHLQAPASGQSPTIGKLGGANSPAPGGAKDPFADLSAFH